MWTSTAADDLKNAFDVAIEKAYGHGQEDELKNLAKLFSDIALKDFEHALKEGLDKGSSAAIDVAWIDKRPIAKITKGGPGAELGDMMLVIHEFDSNLDLKTSRACLLEVKQSPNEKIPSVPVTKDRKSTRNQFAILSKWPELYGLKATGKNKQYLLEKIVTLPNTGLSKSDLDRALSQAWYVAVKPPVKGGPTSNPWMAAPSVDGAEFEHTLGELFGACARKVPLKNAKHSSPLEVGRDYIQGMTLQSPPGWDALIDAITTVAKSYELPPSLFYGPPSTRYMSGAIQHFKDLGMLRTPNNAAALLQYQATRGKHLVSTSCCNESLVNKNMTCFRTLRRIVCRFLRRNLLAADFSSRYERFPILYFYIFHGDEKPA